MILFKNSALVSLNGLLTLREIKILNFLIYNSIVLKKDFIHLKDIKNYLKIKYQQNKQIKEDLLLFSKKIIKIDYLNKTKKHNFDKECLFSSLSVDTKNIVSFEFSEFLKHFLFENNGLPFYKIDISKFQNIKNKHILTFIELIEDYSFKKNNKTSLFFNFTFLRNILGLQNKYKKNSEFKSKVLNPIISELSKKKLVDVKIDIISKNNLEMIKIEVLNTSKKYDKTLIKIEKWLEENPQEIDLYKNCLLSDKIKDVTQIDYVKIKNENNNYNIVFSYFDFLLDVEMTTEDMENILTKEAYA